MGNLTTSQIEKIIMDEGLVYLSYGTVNERLLAPLKSGSNFVIESEIKEIEYEGMRGRTKGMKKIIREDAFAKVSLLDISQENLKLALPSTIMNETTKAITNSSTGKINDSDYIENITILCKTMDDEYKVITIYRASAEGGLNIQNGSKDETVLEITFYAHYDPTDLTSPIYKIEEVATLV